MSNPPGAAPRRRATIIFNPVAGNRRRGLLDATVTALDRAGWQITVTGTTGPASATNLAARAVLAGEDMIVAAGGDGTIREVVAGMADSGIPLGIIPLGTANVLAAEFALPRRPPAIAAAFTAGRRRRLHVPEADGTPFLLMTGAGFDGAVVGAVSSRLKSRLGKGAFLLQGLRLLVRGPSETLLVEIDGTTHRAAWAIVTNISRYGGPYRLVPDSDPGSPTLAAVLFRRAGRLAICGHFLRLALGSLARSRGVTVVDARSVSISGAAPVQIDGDAAGTLPRRLEATGRFVDILVPAED